MRDIELSVVIPVYNEAPVLETVIREWEIYLKKLGICFELLALNDGSTDDSGEILKKLSKDLREISVFQHPNIGHGPTILRGYRKSRGKWILQIDSDREINPEDFSRFWESRTRYSFLIGVRQDRNQGTFRRVLSQLASIWINSLFGTRIKDPNCPFRLMSREFVDTYCQLIPRDTFAPNTAISGFAFRDGWKTVEIPISWSCRTSGSGIHSLILLRKCLVAGWQTLYLSLTARKPS